MARPTTDTRRDRPLRSCPNCGRTFANRNQSHACGALTDIDRHFVGSAPEIRATFDLIVEVVKTFGPVTVLPEKTRIALHTRMSFAAFQPHRRRLDGHLVLARKVDSPRFVRIETFSAHNVLHAFRLTTPAEIDDEFRGWLREAYDVGQQHHLASQARQPPAPEPSDRRC